MKLVYTPVDDNVIAPHKSQVTSHKKRTGIVFMIFLSLYVFLEVSHVEGSSLTTSLRYQDFLSFL